MKLKTYLKNRNKAEFARLIGYKHPTAIFRIIAGENPSIQKALLIEKHTNGQVTLKDLIKLK